jgi:cytochrome P450
MPTDTIAFDPADPEMIRWPFEVYRELRDHDPVHRVERPSYWVLSRFADVFAAARDTETFSSAQGLSYQGGDKEKLGLAPTIVMMDPPEHTAFRRLVSRGFTPRAVAEHEPALRAFVRERLDVLDEHIASDGEADVAAILAAPVPSFIVATYLGVPEADRPSFDGWSSAIVAASAGGDVLRDAQDAVGQLYEYFTALIEVKRADPGDDMISALVHASTGDDRSSRVEVGLRDIGLLEMLGYAFVMIAGGNDTATGLIGGSALLLAQHPDQRRLLVDDPGLIAGAVDELLRLTSPVQGLSRTTTRAVTIHDVEIPEGAKVHLLYGAANRDPREFGDTAEELDVRRTIPRLMTFSSGPHFCLGASAARLQGRVVLEELLARRPEFTVDEERARYAPGAFVRRLEHLPLA